MRCKEVKKKISLLIDGRLGESDRRAVDAHLEGCSECRAAAGLLEELAVGLESLDRPEPREDGWERLVAQIDQRSPATRNLVPAYAFACVIIIAVIALFALAMRGEREIAVAPQPKAVQTAKKVQPPKVVELPKEAVAPKTAPAPVRVEKTVEYKPKLRTVHRIRHKPSTPAISPKPKPALPVDKDAHEDYVAEAKPEEHTSEISYEADRLLAQGFSVLVEASNTKENQGGENL